MPNVHTPPDNGRIQINQSYHRIFLGLHEDIYVDTSPKPEECLGNPHVYP